MESPLATVGYDARRAEITRSAPVRRPWRRPRGRAPPITIDSRATNRPGPPPKARRCKVSPLPWRELVARPTFP